MSRIRLLGCGALLGLLVATAAVCFIVYSCTLYRGKPPAKGTLVIRGGRVWDGTGREPVENGIVVIQGERIACLGKECPIPQDAMVVDAEGLTVLPGLVDMHIHFGALVGDDAMRPLPLLLWDYARARPAHRRAFIEAGVTSIRSVGDLIYIVYLKREVAKGKLAGPRIFTAGPIFTAPGGHPASTLFKGNPWLIKHGTRQMAAPEAARAEVRKLASQGVDGIKAVYTDGVQLPRLSLEVLRAIADEAHKHGLWVAVHASSAQEMREAVLAGADTIEHIPSEPLDEEVLALLRERRVTLVPALAVWKGKPERLKLLQANVARAHAAGVRIAAGTDTQGVNMAFGDSLHWELELLVEAGLTPAEALRAATGVAWEMLGVGVLQPGAPADLMLVEGDPLTRIGDVRNVRVVIQGGRVLLDRRKSKCLHN
jgi:enamidase